MTTCVWNGKQVAADSLGEHNCLKMHNTKIYMNERVIFAGAGNRSWLQKHWQLIKDMDLADILEVGYPAFNKEDNCPAGIIVGRHAPMHAWFLTESVWTKITRPYHAIGSGRDFALAAMRLGKSAREAVEIAAEFDIYTGGNIDVVDIEYR